MSDYATKSTSKRITGIDESKFAKKVDLTNLKSDVDDLDLDKLKIVPFNLSELSNAVKNDIVS